MSHNASSFKSEEFGTFMCRNNIRHITGAPYHPETNGLAERGVQTIKKALAKLLESSKSSTFQTLISRFLFAYRITPHSTTGMSPSELLMGRKLNSAFSAVKPSAGRKWRNQNISSRVTGKQLRIFDVQNLVWVRNCSNGPKWIKGVTERKSGPVSYDVSVRGWIVQRHVDQIRLRVDDQIPLEESIFNDITPEVSFQEDSVRQRSNDENVSDRTTERIEITPNTDILHQPTERDNSIADREIVHSSENNDVIRPVGEPVIATTTQETTFRRSTRTRNQTKFYGID